MALHVSVPAFMRDGNNIPKESRLAITGGSKAMFHVGDEDRRAMPTLPGRKHAAASAHEDAHVKIPSKSRLTRGDHNGSAAVFVLRYFNFLAFQADVLGLLIELRLRVQKHLLAKQRQNKKDV